MLGMLPGILCKGGNVITLYGTTGTPIQANDFDIDPASLSAGWEFRSDGNMRREQSGGYAAYDPTPLDAWASRNPITGIGNRYWIRATNNSGTDPDTGPALSTWHALSTTREWTWTRSSIGTTSGSIKVEIASDSGGTNIVATGYYGGQVTIDPPC